MDLHAMDRLTLATLTTPLIDSGERKEDGKATVTMKRKARRMNDSRDARLSATLSFAGGSELRTID